MPHLIVEYTDNVIEPDFAELLNCCHLLLTQRLPTQMESCKSRVIKHSVYWVGDGQPANAFVSVTLAVLPGRSAETLQLVSQELMTLLKTYFADSLEKLNLQITLELKEVAGLYSKLQSVNLS